MAISERLAYVLTFDTSSGVKSLEKMGSTADKELGRVDSKVDKLGLGMQKFGAGAIAAAGLAGAGLFKLAGSASDLAESVNAVNVTFEDSADGIKKLGEEAARSVGLSKTEFNGLAVQFSSFAKTVAGEGGDVVRTMDDLTTRAADFASVMNLDVAEAARVFQSGLAGETEPLKKFGIDLSAAAVGAYAVANGISESAASMTEAEKVQARYGLLMEQTSQMQGDFANTADGAANQQRILMAELSNLAANIGAGVLPMFTTLVSAATSLTGAFSNLSPEMQSSIGKFGAVGVAALGIAGALSFVVGHAITMRDRFTTLGDDGVRSLNKVGKAAAGVSLALAGIAAVDVAFSVINDIRDVSGSAARNLQALEIAIAELADGAGDGSTMLGEFADIVGDMDAKLNASNIWKEWGKEIKIAGESASRDIEHIDAAFDKVLQESGPGAAQALLDAWTVQAEALDHSSGQYEDNISVIARYQDRVDLAAGAAKAQAGAISDLNTEITESTEATDDNVRSVDEMAEAAKRATERVRDAIAAYEEAEAAQRGMQSASLGYRQQVADTSAAVAEATLIQLDAKRTDGERAQAARDAEAAVLAQADAAVDLAVDQAAANGETLTANEKTALYVAELYTLAQTLSGPARAEIEAHIRRLSDIPTSIYTNLAVSSRPGRVGDFVQPRGGGFVGATGGIVTQPTVAMIGEAGPEAVVPLNRAPGASPLPVGTGGGNTFNVTIMADPNPDVTVRKLREYVRRNGPIQGIT